MLSSLPSDEMAKWHPKGLDCSNREGHPTHIPPSQCSNITKRRLWGSLALPVLMCTLSLATPCLQAPLSLYYHLATLKLETFLWRRLTTELEFPR